MEGKKIEQYKFLFISFGLLFLIYFMLFIYSLYKDYKNKPLFPLWLVFILGGIATFIFTLLISLF